MRKAKIARFKNPERSDDLVRNRLRNCNTVEFLGIWEKLHNPAFNSLEFDGIKNQTGLNSFSWRVETAPPVIAKIHRPGKAKPGSLRGLFEATVDGKPAIVEYESAADILAIEKEAGGLLDRLLKSGAQP